MRTNPIYFFKIKFFNIYKTATNSGKNSRTNAPIGVVTYSSYDNLPENFRSLLPSSDEIAAIIGEIDGLI